MNEQLTGYRTLGRIKPSTFEVAAKLQAAGATARVIVTRFDRPHVGEAVVKEAIERFGRFDRLVHLVRSPMLTMPVSPFYKLK